jgi:hypothetical protein
MDVPPDVPTVTAASPQPASAAIPDDKDLTVSAAAQVIGAPGGDYIFTVDAQGDDGDLCEGHWPAVHVAGLPEDRVIFSRGTVPGQWLRRAGDSFIASVKGGAGLFVLTSVRASDCAPLAVTIARFTGMAQTELPEEDTLQPGTPAIGPLVEPIDESRQATWSETTVNPLAPDALLRIVMRIRSGGEVEFSDVDWAGRLGKGRTVDAFMLQPLGDIAASDIEYKALTGSGDETPWLAAGSWCAGTKALDGLAGFALRLKEPTSLSYDCEYMGYFQSGTITPPVRNGTPCCSRLPRDLLEGIHIRIIAKIAAETPTDESHASISTEKTARLGAPLEIADQLAEITAFAAQLASARAARSADASLEDRDRQAAH